MSRKHTTAKTIKTTGRTVRAVGKGTVATVRFTATHWRGLLPFLCVGAAGAFTAAAELFAWAYGPHAWLWTALVGLVLFVWADGWAYTLPRRLQTHGKAFVLFTVAATIAFIVAASRIEVWLTVGVVALVLGTWWWDCSAYQSHRRAEKARRRMEGALYKLGMGDDTKITGVQLCDNGDTEWRLHMGDTDRVGQLKSEDIAHMLHVDDASRVLIRRVKKSSRNVKIVLLGRSLGKAKAVAHPASRGAVGDWAPGARTIAQGAPVGPQMSTPDNVSVIHSYRAGYGARHKLVAGTTGSGKSVTVRSIAVHVVASADAVLAGVDLVKGGATLLPFRKSMANLLYLPASKANDQAAFLAKAAELLAELRWLRSEIALRTALMAEGKVRDADGEITDVWPASPEHPAIEYVFEEFAATMTKVEALDAALAEEIEAELDGIGQTARSSGIALTIINQLPTVAGVPASLRSNLNQTILHKLNTSSDQGRLWSQYDVDAVSLPLGKGLVYIEAPEGDNPALTRAYDLSKPKDCVAIAEAYAATRPVIAWGAQHSEGAPEVEQAATGADMGADGVVALLRDAAADDDAIPAGAGIIGGAADPEPGDDDRVAAILGALADAADEGLTRPQVEAVLTGDANSKQTALRLLRALQDEDRVHRTGQGKATRYRINTAALAAA